MTPPQDVSLDNIEHLLRAFETLDTSNAELLKSVVTELVQTLGRYVVTSDPFVVSRDRKRVADVAPLVERFGRATIRRMVNALFSDECPPPEGKLRVVEPNKVFGWIRTAGGRPALGLLERIDEAIEVVAWVAFYERQAAESSALRHKKRTWAKEQAAKKFVKQVHMNNRVGKTWVEERLKICPTSDFDGFTTDELKTRLLSGQRFTVSDLTARSETSGQ
jgi:hypothetical protein